MFLDNMPTTPTQIRIDSEVKAQASRLFHSLGLDLSGAINIFLYQCVLRGGLPFKVELPGYSPEVLQAMDEAINISNDPNVKGYSTMEKLKKALKE